MNELELIINECAFFTFSGGERHFKFSAREIRSIERREEIQLYVTFYDSNTIMDLLLVTNALRIISPGIKIYLKIYYFPYARQDRVCNSGEPLSVKVMADIINSQNYLKVVVLDPHSDVLTSLLNNSYSIPLFNSKMAELVPYISQIVSPDAGSIKKVEAIRRNSGWSHAHLVRATKVRNRDTGEIVETNIHDDVLDTDCIIFDDICDGGRTFIELAKVLKEKGARDIYLYVTHGIFSKGLKPLKEHFTGIYCYHTFLTIDEIDTEFLTFFQCRDKIKHKKGV